MSRWWELLARLGRAVLEVAASEVSTLIDELRGSGREMARALFLFLAALGFGLLGLGFAALGLVGALGMYFPEWVVEGLMGVALISGGALLWQWGKRKLARVEPPLATAKRRWQEHDEWWREKILLSSEGAEEPDDEIS